MSTEAVEKNCSPSIQTFTLTIRDGDSAFRSAVTDGYNQSVLGCVSLSDASSTPDGSRLENKQQTRRWSASALPVTGAVERVKAPATFLEDPRIT